MQQDTDWNLCGVLADHTTTSVERIMRCVERIMRCGGLGWAMALCTDEGATQEGHGKDGWMSDSSGIRKRKCFPPRCDGPAIQGRWPGKFARDPTNPSRTNKLYNWQPKLLIKQRIRFCKFLTGNGVAPAGVAWTLAGKVVSRESSNIGGMRMLRGWRCVTPVEWPGERWRKALV
jgi:hypothetical protein